MHSYLPVRPMPGMGLDPMSLDARRIELVVDLMRDARREAQRREDKSHLSLARNALDEILRTKEYEFGRVLFLELERHFTEVRDDLENMRGLIEDKARDSSSRSRWRRRPR